ncbi:MAG: hypothetical protein DLM60_10785, partial [Pseudonocardiales bacterium]
MTRGNGLLDVPVASDTEGAVRMHIRRTIPVASLVLAMGVAVGGCGTNASTPNAAADSSSASVSAQRAYNDTDVRFTQMMLPHHMPVSYTH